MKSPDRGDLGGKELEKIVEKSKLSEVLSIINTA